MGSWGHLWALRVGWRWVQPPRPPSPRDAQTLGRPLLVEPRSVLCQRCRWASRPPAWGSRVHEPRAGPPSTTHVAKAAEPSEPRGGGRGVFRPPHSDPLPGPSVFLENRAGTPRRPCSPGLFTPRLKAHGFLQSPASLQSLTPFQPGLPRSTLPAPHTQGPLARDLGSPLPSLGLRF